MIGVAANPAEHEAVREFFELFKTPWEFQEPGAHYDVLICSRGGQPRENRARLTIIYGSDPDSLESGQDVRATTHSATIVRYKEDRIPIYGKCLSFETSAHVELFDEATLAPVAFCVRTADREVLRLGFDLFAEVRHLLTLGQPRQHAHIPTLELHIALLRDLILGSSVDLLEMPPVPDGFAFIACLTHDVDHAALRVHKGDHTMFGFLYRAVVGTVIDFLRGRKPINDVMVNWLAALSLPLVYLGLVRDFWDQFEQYPEIEGGVPSTFFVIPKSGEAGRRFNQPAPARRAARYDLASISEQLLRLQSTHHEIGLHGIDAWQNADRARAELAAVRAVMAQPNQPSVCGVRMHWLYSDEHSPRILESAGLSYDSTSGYNDTVGYRAGTCQVYKPLGAERLMELPMHAMDTALLFPSHLNLSPAEAKARVDVLIANARRFGGVLTINWHDRSIAPERLWHRLYAQIVAELNNNGAWFATGAEAVAWFQKRRTISFDNFDSDKTPSPSNRAADEVSERLPAVPRTRHKPLVSQGAEREPEWTSTSKSQRLPASSLN
jgi:peptidoglycan/xylan/chitin deacetylase (PgdA/CDA1 family)